MVVTSCSLKELGSVASPAIRPSWPRQSRFPEIPGTLVIVGGFVCLFSIQIRDVWAVQLYRLQLQARVQIEIVRLTHNEVKRRGGNHRAVPAQEGGRPGTQRPSQR